MTGLDVAVAHAQGAFRLDIAFRAGRGLTALFGPSGSGKSTLVNAVAGLVRPARGRIAVDGTVLLDTAARIDVPRHRRRIGYVFQEGRLFPHLSVRQNLLFGRFFAGGRPAADEFEAVVALLGIAPLLARRPSGLSGGETQRVAIGRALLARPRLLLMDEPLAALDEARKAEILPHLERLRDEAGVPIVYVSHAVAEVARLATTVVVLEAGRVVDQGDAVAVLDRVLDGVRVAPPDGDGGAFLEGRIAEHDIAYGLTRLATAAGDLWLPGIARPPGAAGRVRVRARDVMLARQPPEGVSALNLLPGTVSALGPADGPWVDVRLACGQGHLVARVTRRSAEALDLAPGAAVFAVVKSATFDDGERAWRG